MGKFYRTYRPYLILLFFATYAYAGNISDPTVIRDGDFKMLNQELKEVYDNQNNFAVVTDTPNGSRQGKYGDMVIFSNSGVYNTQINITSPSGSTWINSVTVVSSTTGTDWIGTFHGFSPGTSPGNQIVVVSDTAGYITNFLNSYDSGWISVTTSNNYSITHNLGTKQLISTVWFTTNPSGTLFEIDTPTPGQNYGSFVRKLTTTTCKVYTGTASVHTGLNDSNAATVYTSGWIRVFLLALGSGT